MTELTGIGGPAGFQRRLAAGLQERGIPVDYRPTAQARDALLVIGGTRHLRALSDARRRGARIVQRLDGINWLHRRVRTGLRHFLRAEFNNLLLRLVRGRFAHHVVYQSEFVRQWWEGRYGAASVPSNVVHNGVPLDRYTPDGPETPPADHIRLLMVEGRFAGGYEIGLAAGFVLARGVAEEARQAVELTVAGETRGMRHQGGGPGAAGQWDEVDRSFKEPADAAERTGGGGASRGRSWLDWKGRVDPSKLPALYRSAHLLFSGDLNPACPNVVIEAMACGLPVIAYDTGALGELVRDSAGRLAPYGADPWKAELPATAELVTAAVHVLDDRERFRIRARARAEAAFGLQHMLDGYLAALFPDKGG